MHHLSISLRASKMRVLIALPPAENSGMSCSHSFATRVALCFFLLITFLVEDNSQLLYFI